MPHNGVMSAQRKWMHDNQTHKSEETEDSTFLKVSIDNSEFLLPIRDVKEVSEYIAVRAYPVKMQGYLGVVSVRGNVIPVVSMGCFFDSLQNLQSECSPKSDHRMVIVTGETEDTFAIIVNAVRKVSLALNKNDESTVVTVDGRPMRMISGQEIVKRWGELQCSS